jgi:hypothetical protein
MITLLLALLATPVAAPTAQAVQATLQSCAMEGGRWVCRYAVPDIEIVPVPGTNIVADAPRVVLGDAPAAANPPTTGWTTVPGSATPLLDSPAVSAVPDPAARLDAGVLSGREAQLVARCADAGWMSLCLPDDRREARSLRDKEAAYLAVVREVTTLLGQDRCDAAVKAALDGGYLSLARETRAFCATPAA